MLVELARDRQSSARVIRYLDNPEATEVIESPNAMAASWKRLVRQHDKSVQARASRLADIEFRACGQFTCQVGSCFSTMIDFEFVRGFFPSVPAKAGVFVRPDSQVTSPIVAKYREFGLLPMMLKWNRCFIAGPLKSRSFG